MSSQTRLLLVEDKEYDRVLYKEYLGHDRYSYDELDDGFLVINFLQSNPIPDLIVLDWQMPKQNGLDTLKAIKSYQAFKDIPVIIITGLKNEKVLEEAFEFGSVDFLYKPITKPELNARIESAINLSKALKSLKNQKEELLNLNEIISNHNTNLEESIKLKEEVSQLKEQSLNDKINKTKSTLMMLEMKSTKMANHLDDLKKILVGIHKNLKKNDVNAIALGLQKIKRQIEFLQEGEESWDELKATFESYDPNFISKLSEINPRLTPLDCKHCIYIKMNLDNHEIANIFNIELASLHQTRYRLRKKLNLTQDQNLHDFLISL